MDSSSTRTTVSPYHVRYECEDEDGEPEFWTVRFARLTAADLVAAAALTDSPDGSAETLTETAAMFDRMVRSVECNGDGAPMADIPFDVLVDLFALHPSFRPESPD